MKFHNLQTKIVQERATLDNLILPLIPPELVTKSTLFVSIFEIFDGLLKCTLVVAKNKKFTNKCIGLKKVAPTMYSKLFLEDF